MQYYNKGCCNILLFYEHRSDVVCVNLGVQSREQVDSCFVNSIAASVVYFFKSMTVKSLLLMYYIYPIKI